MPDDATPTQAADNAGTQSEQATPQPAPQSPHEMFRFEDALADLSTDESRGVSNEQTPAPEPEPEKPAATAKPASDGVSAEAAPEPVEEAATGTPEQQLSRRQAEAKAKDDEIARLKSEVERYSTPEGREALRLELLAEEQQRNQSVQASERTRADAEKFARLMRVPDADLIRTDPEAYEWREEQKELRARYPDAEAAIRADAELYVTERIAEAERQANEHIATGWDRMRDDITRQIDASAALPGVNKDAFKQPGMTWQQMAEAIHAAASAHKEAELSTRVTQAETENARLKKEVEELRASSSSGRRLPAVVGRGSGAPSVNGSFDPSKGWRGNLTDAFGE